MTKIQSDNTQETFTPPHDLKDLIPLDVLKISIETQDLNVITVSYKDKLGASKNMYKQPAVLHLAGSRFPVEVELPLDARGLPDNVLPSPYPAGDYGVPASSFKVNQYKSLEFQLNQVIRVK